MTTKTRKHDTIKVSAKPIEEVVEKQTEKETISVMLMQSLIVKIIGDVTGKEYIFNGGGSIVEVDKQDIGIINKYNVSTISCCGSYSSPYFKFI